MTPLLLGVEFTDGSILIAVSALISPMLMAWVTARLSRNRQREDWSRQDLVEERLKISAASQEATQARLVQQADAAAVALHEATTQGTNDRERLEGKLDQVHVLVNSKLTESMYRQAAVLDQLIELLTNDVIRLGADANTETVSRRDAAVSQLQRLKSELVDREVATAVADAKGPAAHGPEPMQTGALDRP